MKQILLNTLVPYYQLEHPIDWRREFGRNAFLDVEIGSGVGEFLIRSAQETPQRNFVGLEQLWERVFKTLKRMEAPFGVPRVQEKPSLENVRILHIDARVAFERLFAQESIDRIFCLFPCPWPKRKHIHHRLFSQGFLKLLNSRLKQKGQLKIVSDFYPFIQWVLGEGKGCGFEIKANTIQPSYFTKYERKWAEKGQKDFFELHLIKLEHVSIPTAEESHLKSYRLENFDKRGFLKKIETIKNQEGSALLHHDRGIKNFSVIFKDIIFDAKSHRGLIQLFVAEGHLSQYFWVEIVKDKKSWFLRKVNGQNFFPTPGITQALEIIYELTKNE